MNLTRRIYKLSPKELSEEIIAVAFAKTSRSPEAFDVIAAELNAEKSAKFSEKWIVGYGHSSVAEHAVLHLALENISRLAIETLEANRLASYTEKSTRYQEWNPSAYVMPVEMDGSPYARRYRDLMDLLFQTYAEAIVSLQAWSQAETPRCENESEKAWANRVRVKAVDVARFLLPAAAKANVGVTINARALEYAIKKMLSSELEEVRAIGVELKAVAAQEVPTLVKYATASAQIAKIGPGFAGLQGELTPDSGGFCQLVEADSLGEDKILAALLYRFSGESYASCLKTVTALPMTERAALVDALFSSAGEFDVPLRELEYSSYTFDLVMDQGAYFEFKRHRMMSQTVQPLSTRLGYALPKAITASGFEAQYAAAMAAAAQVYTELHAWNPAVASYVVPNGFNRRVLCQLNMRELFHFVKLRCGENAHFSIRRVARAMLEKVQPLHPLFSAKMCANESESAQSISERFFSAVDVHPPLLN